MREYHNPNGFTVHLTGPDGTVIKVKSKQNIPLPDYYEKYRARGFLVLANEAKEPGKSKGKIQSRLIIHKKLKKPDKVQTIPAPQPVPIERKQRKKALFLARKKLKENTAVKSKVVGKTIPTTGTNKLFDQTGPKIYPVSNNIGVGILSYNRLASLKRLIESILVYTDTTQTTIFISDDASTDEDLINYINNLAANPNFVVIRNSHRAGIAGNTNRLLQCLNRFKYGIILNDDVEILHDGWESFYPAALEKTGFHHMIYRQPGIYGAKPGDNVVINGVDLAVVADKPHGAVLAFTHDMVDTVGYFDESYGLYGMEHVDWSQKAYEYKLQPIGHYDAAGSNKYFKLHSDPSATEDRVSLLHEARIKFQERQIKKCGYSESVAMPRLTYIVPFRNIEREQSIVTVVNNIRAQRFPVINTIICENDTKTSVDLASFQPIEYFLAKEETAKPFNKSKAFNLAIANALDDILILHDADMLSPATYTSEMYQILQTYDACHIGKRVFYTTVEAADIINSTNRIDNNTIYDRIVGYFEGGSLGTRRKTYWNIGGFNEDYKGYGCFLPGNNVLTDSGYKPIEDVTNLDMLYTHNCKFQKIELRNRKYSGDVLNIYVPGRLPIKGVTPEHPFLVKTGDDEFMWRIASQLQIGDIIASTDFIPNSIKPYDFESIQDKSVNRFNIHDHMDDFCYLLGLYLADGVIQTPSRLRTIYFYLNNCELFLAKHVEDVVHRLHEDINVTYDYVKNNCREVRIFNSLLAKLIYSVAGKFKATQKTLSTTFIDSLTNYNLCKLLAGACDGDANHNNGSEQRIIYHTSSLNLAMIMSSIMRRIGIAHSFGRRKGGSFPGSSKYGYDLCVNREFEHLIETAYQKPDFIGSNSIGKTKFGLIYDIKRYHYDGPVYNFEVENDHSYVVNSLIAHNCEDCDFYIRLSNGSKWFENRYIDFLHLWHSRTENWVHYHELNKILEKQLARLSNQDRVSLQRKQLVTNGYGRFVQ